MVKVPNNRDMLYSGDYENNKFTYSHYGLVNDVDLSRSMILSNAITTLLIPMVCLLVFNDKSNVDAQPVVVDEPPTNATEELDVKIDATEPLPPNGTIMVDIAEADDIDVNAIPPEGISVIITNTTVTITNSPVNIEETEEGPDADSIATGATVEEGEEE
jgi:hypothetical protein